MESSCQSVCIENLLTSHEGDVTGMNKQSLSDWVRAEKARGVSYRSLAKALNVSGTAVGKWARQDVTDLLHTTVAAIAVYRETPLSETYKWLGLPQPKDTSDAARIEALERRQQDILEILEHVNERLTQGFLRPDPLALLVQDELYRVHYDLRTKSGYDQFLDACVDALEDRVLAQKIISQLVGASPIERDDYTFLSVVLKSILGPKWTTRHLMEQAVLAKEKYGN